MSELSYRVAQDEAFQAACQRYAHGNGSSSGIAAAALRAYGAEELLAALEGYVEAVNEERERRTKHHAQMHVAYDKMRECERVARAALAKARGQ